MDDAQKSGAQMMQTTLNILPNGQNMEPKSFNNPLKMNPNVDVKKWTSKNRYKSILGGPRAEKGPKE